MMIRPSRGLGLKAVFAPGTIRQTDGAFVVGPSYAVGMPPLGGVLCSLGSDYAVRIAADGSGRSSFGLLDITPVSGTGKAWYLKDVESGDLWSVSFSPVGEQNQEIEVKYLPGQAVISSINHKIAAELAVAVAPDAPCELWKVKLENRSARPRMISFTTLVEPAIGSGLETKYIQGQQALIARRALQAKEPDGQVGGTDLVLFHSSTLAPSAFESEKAAFFGEGRTYRNPCALTEERQDGRDGLVSEAVLSLTVDIDLPIEGEAEFAFCFGVAENVDAALQIAKRFGKLDTVADTIEKTQKHWASASSTLTVTSPDKTLDALINTWLPYEAYAGWVAQRTGGIVFDESQTIDRVRRSYAIIAARPELCRDSLIEFAANLSAAGTYVAEDEFQIVPTADELLWLASSAATYIAETGDYSVLDTTLVLPDGIILTLREQCERAIRRCLSNRLAVKDADLLRQTLMLWELIEPCSSVCNIDAQTQGVRLDEPSGDIPGDRNLPRRLEYLQSICPTLANSSVARLLTDTASSAQSHTSEACLLYRILTERVLGITATPDGLRLAPNIPDSWDEFSVTRQFRGDTYEIHVRRAEGPNPRGSMLVDGGIILGNTVPYFADGSKHKVELTV